MSQRIALTGTHGYIQWRENYVSAITNTFQSQYGIWICSLIEIVQLGRSFATFYSRLSGSCGIEIGPPGIAEQTE